MPGVRSLRDRACLRMSSLLGHRGRAIATAAVWSLVAKTVTAANLFIAVPFVLRDLGPMQFGAWITLVSLVYFAGFLDFGFGNGTMNLIAVAHARNAPGEVAVIFREGRSTLIKVAACLFALVLLLLPTVPWQRLLGLPTSEARNCLLASAAVLLSIVAAVPLNLANRVQLGLGRGELAFRWQAAGQLLALACVIPLALAGASLPLLTLAATGSPLIASLCNTISLWRDPTLAVSAAQPGRPDVATRIRHEGIMFFVMQLSAALAFSADLPLISALRDPAQAGVYAIVQRLFAVIPLSLSLIWAPLWPTYRHALATGHHDWVKQTLRRTTLMAVAIALAASSTILVGFNWITHFWIHRSVLATIPMLLGFSIWSVLEAMGTSLATLLNAASVMRLQMVIASTFAILCFTCKIWTIKALGIEWLPWITAATWSITNAIPVLSLRKRIATEIFGKNY